MSNNFQNCISEMYILYNLSQLLIPIFRIQCQWNKLHILSNFPILLILINLITIFSNTILKNIEKIDIFNLQSTIISGTFATGKWVRTINVKIGALFQ